MKVWAVANQKGGVGKTTTAVSLAGLLAQMGRRILLIDMDPHGSLTAYFGYDPDGAGPGVYALFAEEGVTPQALIRETPVAGVFLMPATQAMAALDRQMGARDGMGLVLDRACRRLRGDFDHVLIDCPPMLGVLMVNALACCDLLVIPVQTEFLALKGLERMMRTIAMIQRSRSQAFDYLIVPTMYDRRTRASPQALQTLQERYPGVLWSGCIPVDTQFREASRVGVRISMGAPRSRGAQAYQALLATLLGDDGQVPARVTG